MKKNDKSYLVEAELKRLLQCITEYVVEAGPDNRDILLLEKYARTKLKKIQGAKK